MKIKLILIGLMTILAVGCSSEIDITNEEAAQEVKQVLEDNIAALNQEDMEGYLSTIAESAHEETREETKQFFEEYDIDYELLNAIVIEEEENKFVLEAEQRAQAVSAPKDTEYRDHVSVNHHTFEKEKGEWKITGSQLVDIHYMD